MDRLKDIGVNIRLSIIVVLAFAVVLVNIMIVSYYLDTRAEIHNRFCSDLKSDYNLFTGIYGNMSELIYHFHVENPEIGELFFLGTSSRDPDEKDRYRKLLYNRLSGIYKELNEHDFRQFHFHEKDNRSYLRFHRPGKFGDDLTDVRYSVAYVNREKKAVSGFEEGRIFNGYRYVFPVRYKKQHIGSVEISVSMRTLLKQISKQLSRKAQFIILKSLVDKKVFTSEKSNYETWFVDENYLIDRDITSERILKNGISKEQAAKIRKTVETNRESDSPFYVEVDINSVPTVLTFLPIKNIQGKNVAYIYAFFDGSKIQELNIKFSFLVTVLFLLFTTLIIFMMYYRSSQKKIERLATFDSLTKVYMRGVIMKIMQGEFDRYKRYATPFSIIMIDIDKFKNINDTYGHTTGDKVLSGVADIMRKNIRKPDFIGRYGGEEFLIILPNTTQKDAVFVAEKLRKLIAENIFPEIKTVTISLGVVQMSENLESVTDFIKEADNRLYTAKNTGRNKVIS